LNGPCQALSRFHRARPQFHGPDLHHGRLIRLRRSVFPSITEV
jgi:hypothetical protein